MTSQEERQIMLWHLLGEVHTLPARPSQSGFISPSSLIRFQANSSCAGLLSYDSSNPGPLHSFPFLWQIPPSSLYSSTLYSFSSSLLCHFSRRPSLSLASLNQSGSSQNLETMMCGCVCVCVCVCVGQLCLTLCDPMDHSLTGSSFHGILQARILEWVAIPFSRGSSQHTNQTWDSYTVGRFFTIWATRKAWKP